MTRKEAKKMLPIIQAYAEGKTVQYFSAGGRRWVDCNDPLFSKDVKYRIKPEPKYRPFKTQEECWNEMLKHQPFGWLRIKGTDEYCDIAKIFDYSGETKLKVAACIYTLPQLFDSFIFTDGTPFGIKDE